MLEVKAIEAVRLEALKEAMNLEYPNEILGWLENDFVGAYLYYQLLREVLLAI